MSAKYHHTQKWTPNLEQFYNTRNGEELRHETFSIDGITFECKLYPNGQKNENIGYVDYRITCIYIPFYMKSIFVYYRLYCPETECDCKYVSKITVNGTSTIWPLHSLSLNDCKKFNQLTFQCDVELLNIELANNVQNPLYKYNKHKFDSLFENKSYTKDIKMNINTNYKWLFTNKQLKQLSIAKPGKTMSSDVFGCWSIGFLPNGHGSSHSINQHTTFQLKLLTLPITISSIDIKYKVFIYYNHQIKAEYPHRAHLEWGGNSTFVFNMLNHGNIDYLNSFAIEICINVLKIYDEHNNEIPKSVSLWSRHGITYLDTEDEESQITDFTASTMVTEIPMIRQWSIHVPQRSYGVMDNDDNDDDDVSLTRSRSITSEPSAATPPTPSPASPPTPNQRSNSMISPRMNYEFVRKHTVIRKEMDEDEEKKSELNWSPMSPISPTDDSYRIVPPPPLRKNKPVPTNHNKIDAKIDSLSNDIGTINETLLLLNSSINNINENMMNMKRRMDLMQKNESKQILYIKNEINTLKLEIKNNQNGSDQNQQYDNRQRAVMKWLENVVKLPQYVDNFILNGYDSFDIIIEMNANELNEIGIKLKGHQFKINKEITKLKQRNKMNGISSWVCSICDNKNADTLFVCVLCGFRKDVAKHHKNKSKTVYEEGLNVYDTINR